MLVVLEAVLALEVAVHLGLDDAVGHGHVDGLEEVLEHLVARLDALLELLACSACVVTSARSSSRVSNSEASWAKSSSSVGQLAHLDRLHGDGDSASSPSWSPPASGAVKVLVSPAAMPTSASSMPSSMLPLPTS